MDLDFYQQLALLSYQPSLQSSLQVILKNAMWKDQEKDLIIAKKAAKHLALLHESYKSSPLLNSSQSLPISKEKGLSLSDLVNWLTSKIKLGHVQANGAGRYRNQLEDNNEAKEEFKEFQRKSNLMARTLMKSFFKIVMVTTNSENEKAMPVDFEKFVELMTSQMIPQTTITREEFCNLLAHEHFQTVLQILDTIQGFVVPNLEVLAHFQSNPNKYFSKIGASLERPLSQAIKS